MSSSGGGEHSGIDFATMRGRDYPSIRQFTVFLENRVGQLLEVVRRFEGSNVRIVALTISDAARLPLSIAPCIHPDQIDVCSPAKCTRPSARGIVANMYDCPGRMSVHAPFTNGSSDQQ